MIDEKTVKCDICHKEEWFVVYDQERKIYVCFGCCHDVGHEPPFTDEEFSQLTKGGKWV